jgi:hypothetical protein
MPILGALVLILQIGLCVHCVKTGRDRQWLFLIVMVPLLGSAVYFFSQVLPEMQNNRTVRRAVGGLARAVDPEGELRQRKDELELSDSVENRIQLADECVEVGYFAEAETLYDSCLRGHHAEDAGVHLKKAQAQFEQDKFAAARVTLEQLIESQPEFKSVDGHLLYARVLEALQDPGVTEEYEALLVSYPGEEARVRYAQWLDHSNQPARAEDLYREVLVRSRRSPRFYRRAQKHWIDIASRRVG